MRHMKVVRWQELGDITSSGTHELGNEEYLRIDQKEIDFFVSLGNPLIELRGIEFEYGVLYRVGHLLNPLPARAAHERRREP